MRRVANMNGNSRFTLLEVEELGPRQPGEVFMANSASIESYLHFEGYDSLPRDFFDRRKSVQACAGRLVMQRAPR